jgi:hypothetical protein
MTCALTKVSKEEGSLAVAKDRGDHALPDALRACFRPIYST